MVDVYISCFSDSTDGIYLSIMVNCRAISTIFNSDIVQYFSLSLARITNKSLRTVDKQIFASELKKFDLILIVDFISSTQKPKNIFVINNISYYRIIPDLP